MTSQDRLVESFEDFLGRCMGMTELDEVDRLLDMELSMSQTKAIFLLHQAAEPITLSVVAAKLRLSPATAGRTVDQLVRAGFAERQEDPADRRAKLVSITEAGREVALQHFEAHRHTLHRLCSRLSAEEADRLLDALRPLLAAVDQTISEQETPA